MGIELDDNFLQSLLYSNNFKELEIGISVMHYVLPVLWILTIIILKRISEESCVNRAGIGYQIYILVLIGVAAIAYGCSFIEWNILQITGCVIASILFSGIAAHSALQKYKEEYVS